jgi:hypothetical protein
VPAAAATAASPRVADFSPHLGVITLAFFTDEDGAVRDGRAEAGTAPGAACARATLVRHRDTRADGRAATENRGAVNPGRAVIVAIRSAAPARHVCTKLLF